MLVVSLAAPEAFDDEALLFGVGYFLVRALHIVLYAIASRGNPDLRGAVVRLAGPMLGSGLVLRPGRCLRGLRGPDHLRGDPLRRGARSHPPRAGGRGGRRRGGDGAGAALSRRTSWSDDRIGSRAMNFGALSRREWIAMRKPSGTI